MKQYILDEKLYESKKNKSLTIKYDLKNKEFFVINDEKIALKQLYKYIKNLNTKFDNIIFFMDFKNDELSLKNSDEIVVAIKRLERIKYLKNMCKYAFIISGNSPYEEFVKISICALNYKSKKDKYNFLYDSVCDYLDDRVVKTNACGFKNDKCIAKRNTNCTMGCCHHYKNKYFGLLYEKKLHLCEYQKNKGCSAKCITCKMYMCDTLKKKGYNFTTKNVIPIKRYFNILQKLVIVSSFFTPKEKILNKIMLLSFGK